MHEDWFAATSSTGINDWWVLLYLTNRIWMMWSFSSSPVKQYRSDVESWILTKLLAPLDNSKFSCTARYLNRGTEHSYSWPIYFQPLTAFSFPLLVVYTSNNSISLSHKTSTSHQHQPASSTFLSQKISTSHQHQPAEHDLWILRYLETTVQLQHDGWIWIVFSPLKLILMQQT